MPHWCPHCFQIQSHLMLSVRELLGISIFLNKISYLPEIKGRLIALRLLVLGFQNSQKR